VLILLMHGTCSLCDLPLATIEAYAQQDLMMRLLAAHQLALQLRLQLRRIGCHADLPHDGLRIDHDSHDVCSRAGLAVQHAAGVLYLLSVPTCPPDRMRAHWTAPISTEKCAPRSKQVMRTSRTVLRSCAQKKDSTHGNLQIANVPAKFVCLQSKSMTLTWICRIGPYLLTCTPKSAGGYTLLPIVFCSL
jgi:hypothetical protein